MSDADPPSARPSSEEVPPAWLPDAGAVGALPLVQPSPPSCAAEPRVGEGDDASGSLASSGARGKPPWSDSNGDAGPSYVFFAVVASVVLLLDVLTKAWAEVRFEAMPRFGRAATVIEGHLSFTLAYNKGGAWGLFRDFGDWIRKPFFLAVSALAIAFLVSLYGRLSSEQRALKWGLPFVLGGALGNLSDRIARDGVVDFIDYRGDWVVAMNQGIAAVVRGWNVTDHWPTFNVADIGISVGVVLMAIDMFLSQRVDATIAATGTDDGGTVAVDSPTAPGASSDDGLPRGACDRALTRAEKGSEGPR